MLQERLYGILQNFAGNTARNVARNVAEKIAGSITLNVVAKMLLQKCCCKNVVAHILAIEAARNLACVVHIDLIFRLRDVALKQDRLQKNCKEH